MYNIKLFIIHIFLLSNRKKKVSYYYPSVLPLSRLILLHSFVTSPIPLFNFFFFLSLSE